MSTRVEFRWPDDLVAAVDKARGSEPRSAFVRRHIEQRVKVIENSPSGEALERWHDELVAESEDTGHEISTSMADINQTLKELPPLTFDPSDAL